jgi:hypothetical protein
MGDRQVKGFFKTRPETKEVPAQTINADDWRLERLIERSPQRIRSTVRFLRQPSSRWLRIPTELFSHGWRRALVFADRRIVDVSNRFGAARR